MTEEEWLQSTKPPAMLRHLGTKASERKLRLLACACCRCIWDFIDDERSRMAVLVAERYADGLATEAERFGASSEAYTSLGSAWSSARQAAAATVAATPYLVANLNAGTVSVAIAQNRLTGSCGWKSAYRKQDFIGARGKEAILLRDIFGNPIRYVTIDPSWRTSTVTALTQAIYADRASDLMPILADALEDAGCTHQAILGHCRGPGPHVRGCWVVDLILGKE